MTHAHQSLPIAYPYVPAQKFTKRYSDADAIVRGTLFPELDLPFADFEIRKQLPKTPMTELMQIDFVCHELRLYLDVHPYDKNAAELYDVYKQKSEAAKKEVLYVQDWINSPWPWDL